MNSFAARIALTITLALALSFGTVKFYVHVNAEGTRPGLDYVTINTPGLLKFEPQEKKTVWLTIQNVSSTTWDKGNLALTTSYSTGDLGRPSIWQGTGWQNNTTILPNNTDNIVPGGKALFSFELDAPKYAGYYKEYFELTNGGDTALNGDPILFTLQVGQPIATQAVEAKEVRVYKSTQQSNWVENGYIVATLPISSGKPGYVTPSGNYRIFNKATEAYSPKFALYMSNWMGLTSDTRGYEGYGLHSLAYWKTPKPIYPNGTIKDGRLYVDNRVYEDVDHLGTPMSHGCIRYDINPSGVLYKWADVGTLVRVI